MWRENYKGDVSGFISRFNFCVFSLFGGGWVIDVYTVKL